MLTVADELRISALDDDLRACVERYVASRRYELDPERDPTPPRRTEALTIYRAGWTARVKAATEGGDTATPPRQLPEKFFSRVPA